MNRHYLLIAATAGSAHAIRHTADRLAALDPEAGRILVALDGDERSRSILAGAGSVLTGEALGLGRELIGRWAGAYGASGILWAALPHVIGGVGQPGDHVLWLGEEVEVVGAPVALWDALEAATFVAGRAAPSLAPYANERADNAKGRPHAVQPATALLQQGSEIVARSMLGWQVGAPAVAALLAEWPVPRDRPTHEEIATPEIAQQWFNGLALHHEATVVGDDGLVFSPAQLLTRTVEAADGDVPLIDGTPLTLLALRGFDPHQPHLLEGTVRTARVSDIPAIAPVLRGRAEALLGLGWASRLAPTRWTTLPDDYPVSELLRKLIRAGMRAGEITRSPFTAEGAAELDTWLLQPARQGGSVGVNRFLEAVHGERKDLHAAYPSLDGPAGLGYLGWAWVYGRDEMALPERWLPPRPAFLDAAPTAAAAGGPRQPDTPGANVAGYLTSELGLGESARQIVHALEAGGVPATPVQGLLLPQTRQQAEFQPVGPGEAHHDVNVIVVNGEQMPGFVGDVGPGFFEGRPSIGVWWWEVDPFPAEGWAPALQWLDEIWVGTDFIRGLVEPHVDVPVWVFPVPVSVARLETPLERSHFGFGEVGEETVFLYMWDYHSTEARKNPSGLVEAYRRAFPDPAVSKTRLVLKCVNHESVPEADEKVRLAAAGRDDIQFIDRFLSGREKNGLLELCDCFVSPHRSEGFGYSPAEAMLLGKPVVVTAYGGTMQFTDETVARMVRWTPARVGEGAAPYPAEGTWAEPDLDDLAGHLRWIVDEPEAAAAMALRGQERIRTAHALDASGRAMRDRLEIVRARATRPEPSATAMPATPSAPGPRSRKQLAKAALKRVPGLGRARTIWWRTQDRSVAARTADLRQNVDALSGTVAGHVSGAEAQRVAEDERAAGMIGGIQELQGVVGELTRRVDDHLLRHSIEPYGIREAGFSVRETPGIGRALGGTDLVSTGDNYADFLSVFRGPYERVKEIMEVYGPLLAGHGPLLDIGCGRGELMEVAEQAGVDDVRGIDLDHELIEQAKARGRNATVGDGIAALRDLGDGALGSVTAIHVLEHLDVPTLEAFFSESIRALQPGGVLAIETINPHEVSAASTFWVDPTHHGPLFPEVALALALSAGFSSAHVFAPDGTGDWDHDRTRSTRYTLLARSAE